MTKSQKELLEEVIQKICKREQWEYVDHVQAQYLANTFLENKEIRQNHSEISLKMLKNIPILQTGRFTMFETPAL